MSLKIIELRGENVKRMKAFSLKPDGKTLIIGGKNGQGKSSLLDSIVLGLGGKTTEIAKLTTKPIREGEKEAWVEIDVGDFRVKRRWTEDSDSLEVTNKDGSRFSSPQKMLDALIGDLSFDPLEFARLPAKEQRATLIAIADIGIDLDAWQKNYDDVYAKRTEIGREVKRLEGAASSLGVFEPEIPDEEVSVTELSEKLSHALRCNQTLSMNIDKEKRLIGEIAQLEETLAQKKKDLETVEEQNSKMEEVDTNDLQQQIENADRINKSVRAKKQYTELEKQLIKEQGRYEKGSTYLKEMEENKAAALAAAKMPIKGLGFDSDGITFKDIPFAQLSQAEQIKVAMGIAMAQNPELRLIRINEGSLLDEDNMAAVQEMADKNDFQLLIERVGSADEMAVIIEDGMILPSAK